MTYTFKQEPKPVSKSSRVTVESIDPEWVRALEAEWAAHQSNPDVNHVVDLGNPKVVTRHASHARAWGLSREGDKVNVRKLPYREGDSESLLRLSMEKHNPNAPKLGRKPKAASMENASQESSVVTAAKPKATKTA